jgi:hypothetical protein
MDVAAASTISNDVTIFFGNGDGTLQLAGQIPIDGGDPSVILARDVNDDGKVDLVVVNAFSTVAVLYGNGNGTPDPSLVICPRVIGSKWMSHEPGQSV